MKEVTETESNRKETRNAAGSLISSSIWNMVVVLAYLFLYMSVLQLLLEEKKERKKMGYVAEMVALDVQSCLAGGYEVRQGCFISALQEEKVHVKTSTSSNGHLLSSFQRQRRRNDLDV
jgi:hypothetical protein